MRTAQRTAKKPTRKAAPVIPTKGTAAWIAWQVQAGARCESRRTNSATAWRHELTTKGDEEGPPQTIKLTAGAIQAAARAGAIQAAARAGAIRGVLTQSGPKAWNEIVYGPTATTTDFIDAQAGG